ncbi:MAG: hypothetical protein Q9222_004014 [Ikaeria aurantiellina]
MEVEPLISEPDLRQLAIGLKRRTDLIGEDPVAKIKTTLRAVIRTASSTKLAESHAAAAYDTLRGYLSYCEDSGYANLQSFAYSQETWFEIFNLFLGSSESRKPKPLKSLLVALERNLSRNPSQSVKNAIVSHATLRIWRIVSGNDGGAVKPALQALRHFLTKSTIQVQDILSVVSTMESPDNERARTSQQPESVGTSLSPLSTNDYLQYSQIFLSKILYWLRYPDVAPSVGGIVSSYCNDSGIISSNRPDPARPEVANPLDQPLWLSSLRICVKRHPESLNLFITHALPHIDVAQTLGLDVWKSKNVNEYHSVDLQIQLSLLQNLKETGVYQDTADNDTPENVEVSLLCHANPQIRSPALALVLHSSSPKEPFKKTILSSMRHVLPFYHEEVDPKNRQENLASIKKFCIRLAGSLRALRRHDADSKSSTLSSGQDSRPLDATKRSIPVTQTYARHLVFFAWYWRFLTQELSSTASYQRHIMALKVIGILLLTDLDHGSMSNDFKSLAGSEINQPEFSRDELLTSLFDLVLDSFDDVRESAVSILQILPKVLYPKRLFERSSTILSTPRVCQDSGESVPSGTHEAYVTRTLHRAAVRMKETARADHADGFGQLEQYVKAAQADILLAVKKASLHGHLIAARYQIIRHNRPANLPILDTEQLQIWQDIIERLLKIADDVWRAVQDILCADAPEGYEIHAQDDQVVGTKDLLSYCWRALKESSTLLDSMLAGYKHTPMAKAFGYHHYREFGELAFTQLENLRHRGAFSTVSQTFAVCCIRCAQSEDSRTQALLDEWYQKSLLCIRERSSALTRRSAGLPAMITGIMLARIGTNFFDNVIRELQRIADASYDGVCRDNDVQIPQVHAFNCLKDIFTDGRFDSSVGKHMSASLELAARGLESNSWAIRNCGLMLMKALITRLNAGVNTSSSKATSSRRRLSTVVYDKHQSLPDLILRLLSPKAAVQTESPQAMGTLSETLLLQAQFVFPALEMIEQSGIPNQYRAEIHQAVWSHLEGPAWPIRDKAAKALSYLPDSEDIGPEVECCLQLPWQTQNALHGRFMYLRYLVHRLHWDTKDTLRSVMCQTLNQFNSMISRNPCPITRASYTAFMADVIGAWEHAKYVCETLEDNNSEDDDDYSKPLPRHHAISPATWKAFTAYLRETPSEEPAFALERIAKDRCKSTVKRPPDHAAIFYSLSVKIEDTIFANLGDRQVPLNPDIADQMLRATGSYLALLPPNPEQTPFSRNEMLACWIRALKLAQDELSEVSTRQAAVDSLSAYLDPINDGLAHGIPEPATLLQLHLRLYDSLLDDDEEVRASATAVASKVLSTQGSADKETRPKFPLMVPAARYELLEFIEVQYHVSSSLATEAAQRIVGVPPSSTTTSIQSFLSPRASLHKILPDDTSLFAEEKQNLYIDEAREAETWRDVLLSLDHQALVLETDVMHRLQQWTIEGLDALIEVAEEKGVDGALGWTSKADVFTFGVRVLCAAEAVVRMCDDEKGREMVRGRLRKLLEVGEERELCPGWLRMISGILGGGVGWEVK